MATTGRGRSSWRRRRRAGARSCSSPIRTHGLCLGAVGANREVVRVAGVRQGLREAREPAVGVVRREEWLGASHSARLQHVFAGSPVQGYHKVFVDNDSSLQRNLPLRDGCVVLGSNLYQNFLNYCFFSVCMHWTQIIWEQINIIFNLHVLLRK